MMGLIDKIKRYAQSGFNLGTLNIAVIGLGYVGLPLAVALAKSFPVKGYDINTDRINQLKQGYDRTREVNESALRASSLVVTSMAEDIQECNLFIVTVPTPVDAQNTPDLSPVEGACKVIGPLLKENDIVVFESTVYPGVTEDIMGPLLESLSKLKSGRNFFLGYSPERINPGDKIHTVDKITKVVAGQTPEVADLLTKVYGTINNNNIFVAKNIKTAEAAKVIENAQRDINIAFINEITAIFQKVNLSIYDVLAAAQTKWNFMNFQPGLVGGHCIGVDPYYLAHFAQQLGHPPDIILAGRRINEQMSQYIGQSIHQQLQVLLKGEAKRILVLGLTFKENVPDLRNSKVIDLIQYLKSQQYDVDVHDPYADPTETSEHYNIELKTKLDDLKGYDCVVGAVPHQGYANLGDVAFGHLLSKPALIADIKNIWREIRLPKGVSYWSV
jgi:UDP-N-acetyl-D-galactosamine dehydrogenase